MEENQKTNKTKLSTFIIVLAVLVIIIMAGFIYMQKINADREIAGLKNDAEELKATVTELQGKLSNISEVASTNNTTNDTENSSNTTTSANNLNVLIPDSNMNFSENEERLINDMFQGVWINDNGNKTLVIDYGKRFCLINNNENTKVYGTYEVEDRNSSSSEKIILTYTSGKKEEYYLFQGGRIGKALANIHLHYEKPVEPSEIGLTIEIDKPDYTVQQMKFPKEGKKALKHTISYNEYIRISNIPERVYDYIINGKSAVEWIMERYAITTDKASGITNNPNDWCAEHNNPRYILDLILSCITVSLKTLEIVENLPSVDF